MEKISQPAYGCKKIDLIQKKNTQKLSPSKWKTKKIKLKLNQ